MLVHYFQETFISRTKNISSEAQSTISFSIVLRDNILL